MQHFTYIQAADLYALLPLAGKNDKRVYLNGIKVEAAGLVQEGPGNGYISVRNS